MSGNDFVVYCFHPEFWPYVEALGARYVIYHAYDAYDVMPGWRDQLTEWRSNILERAQLSIVSNIGSSTFYSDNHRSRTRELTNGVDVALFSQIAQPCPVDLGCVPEPRIGYLGVINSKLDLDLIEQAAVARPDWNWVFVGRCDLRSDAPEGSLENRDRRTWDRLTDLGNVRYLGERLFAEVSAYARHMSVNTICYRTSDDGWWSFGSPNKLFESLAIGRPVVATAIRATESLESVVGVAHGLESLCEQLQRAIDEDDPVSASRRIEVALANSWEKKVDTLEGWIAETVRVAGV